MSKLHGLDMCVCILTCLLHFAPGDNLLVCALSYVCACAGACVCVCVCVYVHVYFTYVCT